MSAWGLEARVGAFLLAAVAILVAFVLALGDVSFGGRTRLLLDFGFSGGLQAGAPVKVSGVKIGKVAGLELLGPTSAPPPSAAVSDLGRGTAPIVRALLDIEPTFAESLGESSRFAIATQGVIGEAYVEVSPGAGPALAAGSALRGVDAARLHDMVLQMATLVAAMSQLLGIDAHDNPSPAGGALGPLGESIANLVNRLGGILDGRQGELSQALADLGVSAAEMRQITGAVRRALGDGSRLESLIDHGATGTEVLARELPALVASAKRSTSTLEALLVKADGAVDPQALGAIVADIKAATADLRSSAQRARAISDALGRGEGTVGGLLKDSQIYDDVKEMLRDLKRNPWKFMWRD